MCGQIRKNLLLDAFFLVMIFRPQDLIIALLIRARRNWAKATSARFQMEVNVENLSVLIISF